MDQHPINKGEAAIAASRVAAWPCVRRAIFVVASIMQSGRGARLTTESERADRR